MQHETVALLSKSASAYEHLKRLATRGLLRPDRRLSPPDVATELQISVTPVRDALARLAAEGFIRGADGRGYFTKLYTVQEQRDLQQFIGVSVLANLRAGGGEASASRALEALELVEASSGAAPKAAALACAMGEFLTLTAGLSGNRVVPPLVRNAVERTGYIRQLDYADHHERLAVVALMRELVEHAAARDLARMIDAIGRRLRRIEARLPLLVESANQAAARLKFP